MVMFVSQLKIHVISLEKNSSLFFGGLPWRVFCFHFFLSLISCLSLLNICQGTSLKRGEFILLIEELSPQLRVGGLLRLPPLCRKIRDFVSKLGVFFGVDWVGLRCCHCYLSSI